MYEITEMERRAVVEAIKDALAEAEQSTDISQGVVDKLEDSLRILGESEV